MNVFDFLKGGKPIPIELSQHETIKKETCDSASDVKSEKWTFYTLNIESKSCPLDCLIIHNYFKYLDPSVQIKIVNCASCSPNGKLPILVANSDGRVLEFPEIIEKFFEIVDIKLYAAIDGLLGDYIRINSGSGMKKRSVDSPSSDDVMELVVSLDNCEFALDPTTKVLLFSMIQGAKMGLDQSDRVRQQLEKSEYLNNEIFINLLENQTSIVM